MKSVKASLFSFVTLIKIQYCRVRKKPKLVCLFTLILLKVVPKMLTLQQPLINCNTQYLIEFHHIAKLELFRIF